MFPAAVFRCALSVCLLFAGAGSIEALTWPSSGANLLPQDYTPYALTSTEYNGRLYLAWHDSSNNYMSMANSPDGTHWTASYIPLPHDQSPTSPRLGVIGGDVGMYMLWAGIDGVGGIWFSNSSDGQIWEPARRIVSDSTPFAPSLVYVPFENRYFLVYHATVGYGNGFFMTTSSDLYYWQRSQQILPYDGSPSAPILFFNGQQLQLLWQGTDNHLWHSYSYLGIWSTPDAFLVNDYTPAGLSGCFFNGGTLYITWQGVAVSGSGIWISSTSDFGDTWQASQNIVTNDQTGAAVAITQFKQKLYLAYKSATSQSFYIAASQ